MIDNKCHILDQTIKANPSDKTWRRKTPKKLNCFSDSKMKLICRLQNHEQSNKKIIVLGIFFPCCIAYLAFATINNLYNKIRQIF